MPLNAHPITAAVYAKDAWRLANFYSEVLDLTREEEGPTFVLLSSEGLELSIIQSPPALAERIQIAEPPEVRESTPIKLSLLVGNLESTRPKIVRLGGGLKASAKAWSWRGAKHLDGWDPEGNVFQLRQSEA